MSIYETIRNMLQIEIMGDRVNATEPGMLANAILEESFKVTSICASTVSMPSDKFDVLIYARRVPDTLSAVIEACERRGSPLLLLSTSTPELPEAKFPLVVAPNTSFEVLNYIDVVVAAALSRPNSSVVITEHHQPTKKDISGTAKMIAHMVGESRVKIISIRDWERSRQEYGLEESSASGYAIHSTVIDGLSKPFEVVVQGRRSYAADALAVAQRIAERDLEPGTYRLEKALLQILQLG